jgi:hypothetical protein
VLARQKGSTARFAYTRARTDGTWQLQLPPGDYQVGVEQTGCSFQPVHVESGKPVTGVALGC